MNQEYAHLLDRFVEVLDSKNIQLTGTEIADILWLTGQIHQENIVQDSPASISEPEEEEAKEKEEVEPLPVASDSTTPTQVTPSPPKAELIPKIGSITANLTVKAPDASSLGNSLNLARSLRPLIQKSGIGRKDILDETATSDRMARYDRLPLPVFTARKQPWLDLVLVIDESQSMVFWRSTIEELQNFFKHYGIFRGVEFWKLKPLDGEKSFELYRGDRSKKPSSPKALIDPSGRRLILIISDGVADYWYNGKMLDCLKKWGKYNSVSMVQMLPDWLWLRTGLRLGSAVRLGSLTPASTNQNLAIKEILIDIGITIESGIKLPVFTLEAKAVKAWSSLIAGRSEARSAGFVFAADFKTPAIAHSETLLEAYTPRERIDRFLNLASPTAQDLASLLSAAPVITLPIVRLMRETMLEDSQQIHVAEVFLGGLLKSLSPVDTPPDEVVYGFITEEIRDILLGATRAERSFEVLNEVSKYVARRLKRSLREFAALIRDPRQAQAVQGNFDLKAFAEVEAKVFKRLGDEAAKFAEELENTWQEVTEVVQTNLTIEPLDPIPSNLQLFSAETVFVNKTGRIIRREPVQAYYYEESLGEGIEPLRMMAIPQGEFMMGSPEEEKDRFDNESPQHQVTVPAFFMSQTLITQAQWRFIASLPQEGKTLKINPSRFEGGNIPVERVSWQDAIEFCARLSRYTGRNYRLPSEAEWEYACRAINSPRLVGEGQGVRAYPPFHFGETITSKLANYTASVTYQEEAAGEYSQKTIPVKSFPPNAFGLYDMHRNVWEWCLDPWHGNYEDAPNDGSVWDKNNINDNRYQNIPSNIDVLIQGNRTHVLRGGSWNYNPWGCRSASRGPYVNLNSVGFRVVCAPS